MGRNRLPDGERKEAFVIRIEGKHLKGQNENKLKEVAYDAILKHLKKQKSC